MLAQNMQKIKVQDLHEFERAKKKGSTPSSSNFIRTHALTVT
jgi:hypothetical protein